MGLQRIGTLDSGRSVIDSAGKKKQRSSNYFKYVENEKMRNKIVSTRCKPKDFKRVVSRLSKMKAAAVSDMGMGNLTMIGCTLLHRPLIQMLAEKFNPVNNSIQIHGQTFSITESDFRRIMGIAGGGSNIDNTGSMEDPYFTEFVDTFDGNKNEITIEQLKVIVEDRDEVDYTFRIAFFMYTLATILCPGASKHVDPKLLLPLRDTKVLDMKNWAHFLFQKLIEGLKAFKNNMSDYLTGCIIFLQLFYVDIVGHSTLLVDKGSVPVVAWGNWEVKRLIERVERNGGFDSLTVFVSEQPMAKMGATGPSKYALHPNPDIQKVDGFRVDLEAVKMELPYLSCTIAHMEAGLSSLREKVGRIEKSLTDFKDEIVRLLDAKVLELRKEESGGMSFLHEHIEQPTNKSKRKHDDSEGGNERKRSEGGTSQSPFVLSYEEGKAAEKLRAQAKAKVGADKGLNVADNEGSNCSTGPALPKAKSQKTKYNTAIGSRHTDPCIRELFQSTSGGILPKTGGLRRRSTPRVTVGPFTLKQTLSPCNTKIINFLFGGMPFTDVQNSESVANEGGITLSRGDLSCLAPNQLVSSDVINLWAEYLSAAGLESWYFPTLFVESATVNTGQVPTKEWTADTISKCRLQRFLPRILDCTRIFIPMYDCPGKHWYLLVVRPLVKLAEIWDSHVDKNSADRRKCFAVAALTHLDMLDSWDIFKRLDPTFKFAMFNVIITEHNPQQPNEYDCGIYVIRHMQHYKERWYDQYESDHQRCKIALETVKHRQNQLRASVKRSVRRHHMVHISENKQKATSHQNQ